MSDFTESLLWCNRLPFNIFVFCHRSKEREPSGSWWAHRATQKGVPFLYWDFPPKNLTQISGIRIFIGRRCYSFVRPNRR